MLDNGIGDGDNASVVESAAIAECIEKTVECDDNAENVENENGCCCDQSATLGVQFRERRRTKKARPRRPAQASEDTAPSHIADEERELEEIALLRKAQQIRQQSRAFRSDSRVNEESLQESRRQRDAPDSHVVGGLKQNFAVESSGYDAQKNMEEYIERRLAEKLASQNEYANRDTETNDNEGGNSGDEESRNVVHGNIDEEEAALYVIPERLRLQPREQYDPAEGLPAAGVEEVDVGHESRRRTAVETAIARRQLLQKARDLRAEDRDVRGVSGNVSSNFEKHRRDWNEAHLGPRKPHAESFGRPPKANGKQPPGSSNISEGGRGFHGKRYHVPTATDHIVADRFRKRWRK